MILPVRLTPSARVPVEIDPTPEAQDLPVVLLVLALAAVATKPAPPLVVAIKPVVQVLSAMEPSLAVVVSNHPSGTSL